MSGEATDEMDGKRSFEERVFARFDALDSALKDVYARLGTLDARAERLEERSYDTKPIWEQALREIMETRRELSKRLDRVEGVVPGNRADVRDLEERVERLRRIKALKLRRPAGNAPDA